MTKIRKNIIAVTVAALVAAMITMPTSAFAADPEAASDPAPAAGNEEPCETHTFGDWIVTRPATRTVQGSKYRECTVCHYREEAAVSSPATMTLSARRYSYNGKLKRPSVTIRDTAGNTISSVNYSKRYSRGCRKVGTYTVTCTFKGQMYRGTMKKRFNILPPTTRIVRVTRNIKSFSVKWSKKKRQVSGYQVRYSRSSRMKRAKHKTIRSYRTTTRKFTRLRANTRYYVQVRTFKKAGKKTYCSVWSKPKRIKTLRRPRMSASRATVYNSYKKKLYVNGGKGRIKWRTSNSSVAAVSSRGTVKGRRAGRCTITAKRNGYTVKCRIRVPAHYRGSSVPDFGALYGKIAFNRDSGDGYQGAAYRASSYYYNRYLSKIESKGFIFWQKADGVLLYVNDEFDFVAVAYYKGSVAVVYGNLWSTYSTPQKCVKSLLP
ncbi:MAG: fibronectin type III domain-containing protein [Anaerovoracaceae bacterium]|jgi:hypothetical protein